MARTTKKKHSNKVSFKCPYCNYAERSVRAKKFKVCPMCGKEVSKHD